MNQFELESQLAEAERQRGLMEYAAQVNHEKWQAAQAQTLERIVECYPVSVNDVRRLVQGFGEMAVAGFHLEDFIEALKAKYPQWGGAISQAFERRGE